MADKPVTREEKYLSYLTGDYTGELPKPITRKEKYLYELCLKGMGGEVSPEEIKSAVNEYLEKNPVKPGATTEQAQQIEQNKTDIASLKTETSSLKEDVSTKITKFYASSQGETHITDSDNGKIQDMMIYGKSSQDGTPTPENPVEIKSVVNPTVKVTNEDGLKVQSVTLNNITLNAIPVSSGGNVTIDGQQYIADYVDVEKEKLYRKVKRLNLKDVDDIVITHGFHSNGNGFLSFGSIENVNEEQRPISNRYEGSEWTSKSGYVYIPNSDNIVFVDDRFTDRQTAIKLVQDTYVIYALSSQTEEDLSLEQIKSLSTYYPTTNISVNSEQLDGYTVFNYPTPFEDEWIKAKEDVDSLKKGLVNIAIVGKNLFNPNGTRHFNSRIDDVGDIVAGDNIVYEFPIGSGTYVSNMPTFGVNKISCISKDGVATIITPSTTSDFEEHFTLPDGTVKVYMSFWSGRDSEVESTGYIIFKKGMIVSGNTLPSKYIPYYKNLNDTIKVNESNIEDGTNLTKYVNKDELDLFSDFSNLFDSTSYKRGQLGTDGTFSESTNEEAPYIYEINIPNGKTLGMNAVPQAICFYDENMDFLEFKQFADTSDDTVSVSIPAKSKYAKLSYWYGRGVDGQFMHVTHFKDVSITVDSVPFSAIKREPVFDSSKKISRDNLCDGFELNSKLAKGIKWYILGDSRSVDTAYTAKFYHDYLCEKHKFIRKKNLAVSGARIRSADAAYHSLLEQYPNVEDDADLITVYAGINDYGQDNPTEIGTEGSTDLTTFYGAFESLITNLITNHPTAKIVVITPIPQYNFEINNTIVWGERNDTNSLGKSLDDYCNVIKKVCGKYGVFVKDACHESGITPRIASQRTEYFKDGLHHNEKGQLVLANYLSDIFDLLDC